MFNGSASGLWCQSRNHPKLVSPLALIEQIMPFEDEVMFTPESLTRLFSRTLYCRLMDGVVVRFGPLADQLQGRPIVVAVLAVPGIHAFCFSVLGDGFLRYFSATSMPSLYRTAPGQRDP